MRALYFLPPKYQGGGALLLVVMLLMALALSALAVSGQQALLLTRHYALDWTYFKQRAEIEAAFEQLATAQASSGISPQGTSPDVGRSLSPKIQSSIIPEPCAKENVEAACFRVLVQYEKGLVRERLLVVPEPGCGSAYWYSPANRIGPREI